MNIARRRFLQFAAAAVAVPARSRNAMAQAFPTRPITMIVPFPARGPAGAGSPSHIAALYFQDTIGVRFQLVPYRGTPQVIQDLVGGQVDILFDQVSSSLAQVRAGTIKAFAVTARSRLAAMPEIPSV